MSPLEAHATARIATPVAGDEIGDELLLSVAIDEGAPVERVDYIGLYEDFDYEGNGVYRKVKKGDNVKAHYKGTLTDGTEFDNSSGKGPIEFEVGSGKLIPGFEKAVIGMEQGDKKTFTVPVDDAYGPRLDQPVVDPLVTSPRDNERRTHESPSEATVLRRRSFD